MECIPIIKDGCKYIERGRGTKEIEVKTTEDNGAIASG